MKLAHIADMHLDAPARACGGISPTDRRAELRETFTRIMRRCTEERCDVILICGDLFDSTEVSPAAVAAAAEAMARTAPARVFIAPGNHDPLGRGSPYLTFEWPENVHIFRDKTLTRVELPALSACVYGRAAYPFADDGGRVLRDFCVNDPDKLNLCALHGLVAGVSGAEEYCPVSTEEIAASGLDYLALGHVHIHRGFSRAGGTVYAYSGCPEGRGFDETGPKGFLLGEADKGRIRLDFIPTALRRYHWLELDVSELVSVDEVAALVRQTPELGRRDIVRVTLKGERNPALAPTQALLAEALADDVTDVQLVDARRAVWDPESLRGESTLRGVFARRMLEVEGESREPKDLCRLAAQMGLAALAGEKELPYADQ